MPAIQAPVSRHSRGQRPGSRDRVGPAGYFVLCRVAKDNDRQDYGPGLSATSSPGRAPTMQYPAPFPVPDTLPGENLQRIFPYAPGPFAPLSVLRLVCRAKKQSASLVRLSQPLSRVQALALRILITGDSPFFPCGCLYISGNRTGKQKDIPD